MTQPHKHPTIYQTRAELIKGIRDALNSLKEGEAPLVASALESLFNAYLSTLPVSYRGDDERA